MGCAKFYTALKGSTNTEVVKKEVEEKIQNIKSLTGENTKLREQLVDMASSYADLPNAIESLTLENNMLMQWREAHQGDVVMLRNELHAVTLQLHAVTPQLSSHQLRNCELEAFNLKLQEEIDCLSKCAEVVLTKDRDAEEKMQAKVVALEGKVASCTKQMEKSGEVCRHLEEKLRLLNDEKVQLDEREIRTIHKVRPLIV